MYRRHNKFTLRVPSYWVKHAGRLTTHIGDSFKLGIGSVLVTSAHAHSGVRRYDRRLKREVASGMVAVDGDPCLLPL